MFISRHISFTEATRSATAAREGIDNIPNPAAVAAMRIIAEKVFEPTRAFFNRPIIVSSFYRSPRVNALVGGSRPSQHVTGEAMDIQATAGFTNAQLFAFILRNLEFDQLIWEFGTATNPAWVHVSYTALRANKKEVMVATRVKGRVRYEYATRGKFDAIQIGRGGGGAA